MTTSPDDQPPPQIDADEINDMDDIIEELFEIMRQDLAFEEKAHRTLTLGKKFLNVENAHLTRIDTAIDHWEAMESTDPPDGQIPPGLSLDLGTTYCRRVIEENRQIALYDAPRQGFQNDTAYKIHGLHCYLGNALIVGGEQYGTVCFVDESPREQPFTELDRLFAALLSQLLERELEKRLHEQQLTRQSNLAIVLNRVLRHNLRNDLSVVRGYTDEMARERQHDEFSEIALRKIDELIELGEKARELDEIVGQSSEPYVIDVRTMVENIIQEVTLQYPEATATLRCTNAVELTAQPSLQRAIEELIENAAKHTGSEPSIQVTITEIPNAVKICVEDGGTGLNQQDASVLRSGQETALLHGSGLGLWLVHWIVTSHDGTIDVDIGHAGTTISLTIPRKADTKVQEEIRKLTRARDQFAAAFGEANDGMVIINNDARIVEANDAAANIYGMGSQRLLGQQINQFLPNDFDFATAWQQFLDGKLTRDSIMITGSDGVDRPVEFSARPNFVPGQHLLIVREIVDEEIEPAAV